MKGRALVDIPQHDLACGDFGEIPDKEAKHLVATGAFDSRAPFPEKPKAAADKAAPGPSESAALAPPETAAAAAPAAKTGN